MRIKNEIEYVIRILLYLTKYGENRIVSSNEISDAEDIPHLFSLRILKKLEKASLVKIFKGARGGYQLTKPSEEITLRDAVETIEPVICIKDCVNDPESCSLRKGECAVHRAFNGIQREFIKALESRNFKELAEETYQECKYNK
ncbi:RrF2 family transcriptional regulator [Fusobacterium mortiferum]|jgi:Rrf2 family iron-responsive transcriptional regulator|uniref:Rrf2 family transcriptional regulator n=2 Tax=Fusobacterium mortiferum TaxID=850 RepID=A0A414PVB0_FUSMR|nr:Rrf2 family transcriptional regulator [Fusobacterium mortiferum]AVQ19692.1 Rrf2 family transcriptional regulator [Fusobacterium mortiferum ATCC 9817]EEO35884.1 transcriptional regulator, Rrf2 family [Fusobacterium mortiferum ATCC 9817]MCF2627036.1 Rrf2 family transcriptional regulator [Fusobacterium mortiferum]MCF2698374.1 Rrf2 family transcriptional regulator [Fusobacterium mortiferum]MCI6383195.1 Rrf2 family transcriptional regulator [Fusobacterium mortiferum]